MPDSQSVSPSVCLVRRARAARPRRPAPGPGALSGRSASQPASATAASAQGVLVVGAEAVPAIQLHRLRGELPQPGRREPGQHRVERLLLADAGLEGVLALEAGGDPQRLAAVLAEAA